ncbi:hypothetical protein [Pseudomonas brassicacearum]|uniref:hypothetical protein n=1 Tax=Pseudomonas brassicacearum TaxID=930166 RepID=UPI001181DC52|nr:hypothetical protein [Pseudomonas brassicacearum]
MNADFHLKEEGVARCNFFEGFEPSLPNQGASSVTWYKAIYRLWGKQGEAGGQLKIGLFFISRTHCLWDVVGILLGRAAESAKANDLAVFRAILKWSGPAPNVCIK